MGARQRLGARNIRVIVGLPTSKERSPCDIRASPRRSSLSSFGVPLIDHLVAARRCGGCAGDRRLVARHDGRVGAGARRRSRTVRVDGGAPKRSSRGRFAWRGSGRCKRSERACAPPRRSSEVAVAVVAIRVHLGVVLAGQPRDAAMSAASETMEELAISPFARAKLQRASLTVRRATVVAAALATGAPVLLVEDPGVDLPPEARGAFLRLVVRALAGRRTAFFAARVSLESAVGLAADEAILIDGGRVAIQGAPAQIASSEHAFSLRLAGDVRAFEGAVATRGARLLVPSNPTAPTRLSLDIGPLTTTELLRIALECNAVVLELHPLAGAFA